MIYARRTPDASAGQTPPESAPVVDPPSGAFAVYFNGAQVGDTVSAGEMLVAQSVPVTITVKNSGAALLSWQSIGLTGAASAWFELRSGAAALLASGEAVELSYLVLVPGSVTEGTYTATLALTAADQAFETVISIAVKVPAVDPSPSPPVPPTGVVAVGGNARIDVSWTGSATAEFYLVRGSTGGPFFDLAQVDGTYAAITSGITNGLSYTIVVLAANNDTGLSAPSDGVVAKPNAPLEPDPEPGVDVPQDVEADPGVDFVSLTWQDPAGYGDYWARVYTTGGVLVKAVQSSVESALVVGLTASTSYDVTVFAVDSGTQSEESEPVRFTTLASGGEPGTPPLDRADTMTVYALQNAGLPNALQPTANIRKMPAIRLSGASSFAAMGQAAAQVVQLDPVEHRILHLNHVGQGRTDRPDLHDGVTPYTFLESNGYANDSAWSEGLLEFWAAFADFDLPYIYLDEELFGANQVGPIVPVWYYLGNSAEERAAKFAPIFADPAQKKKLPLALRLSSVAELATIDSLYHPKAYLVGLWDHLVFQLRADSMRRIVGGTYETVTGRTTTVFNYDDARMHRKFVDVFNEQYPAGYRAVSPVSSHFLYLYVPNSNMKFTDANRALADKSSLTKAPRWNLFIDYINAIRGTNYPQIPNISRLRYNGNNLPMNANPQNVVEIIKHVGAMGIDRHVLFCATTTDGDVFDQDEMDEYQSIVERVRVYPRPVRRLPVVPYDAERVTTGEVTTVYDEAAWTPGGVYDPVEV